MFHDQRLGFPRAVGVDDDPMGIIRNRDGVRASTAAAEQQEAREIMAEMAKEAHRLKG